MSGTLFNLPNARQLSIAGAILPGFKLKFFLSGTLTPTPVYADAALTTHLGTTVAAAIDGHMPPIYLSNAILYRVQIYDVSNVLQPDGDVDPVNILPTGVQSVVAGTNVTVDNSDPRNPIVSASGGGGGGSLTFATLQADQFGGITSSFNITSLTQLATGQYRAVMAVGMGTPTGTIPLLSIQPASGSFTLVGHASVSHIFSGGGAHDIDIAIFAADGVTPVSSDFSLFIVKV